MIFIDWSRKNWAHFIKDLLFTFVSYIQNTFLFPLKREATSELIEDFF